MSAKKQLTGDGAIRSETAARDARAVGQAEQQLSELRESNSEACEGGKARGGESFETMWYARQRVVPPDPPRTSSPRQSDGGAP